MESFSQGSQASPSDLKALNSSVLLLSQKLQYVVRNEKVLGRNLLVLNRKLDELKKRVYEESGEQGQDKGDSSEKAKEIEAELARLEQSLMGIRESVSSLEKDFVKKEEFKELRYVIDAMNPLDFVTHKQLKEALKGLKKK